MKTIQIKKIEMNHFRGFTNKVVEFGSDVTNIGGGNGSGKSTIRNAFLWCLFGKDAEGRTDYEIKHRGEGGETLDKVDANVRITLNVDSRETVLERSLREKWVKKRGQAEEVFSGNETAVSVDEVPMSVSQYKEKVEEIIPESLFRLITTPEYFLGLPWRDQRAILFNLVGGVDDREVANESEDFVRLLDDLNGKTLGEYRKEIAMKKKKAKEELAGIQPRIDQTEKLKAETTPEMSLGEVEEKVEALTKEIDELDKKAREAGNNADGDGTKYRASIEAWIYQRQSELSELREQRKKREDAVVSERREEKEKIWDLIQKKSEDIVVQKGRISDLEEQNATAEREIREQLQYRLQAIDRQLEEMRDAYRDASSGQWSGEEICPTCKRRLPEEEIENAKEIYNKSKLAKLEELAKKGKDLNQEKKLIGFQIEEKRSEISARKQEIEEQNNVLQSMDKERNEIRSKYNSISLDYTEEPSLEENRLQKEIEDLKAKLAKSEEDMVKSVAEAVADLAIQMGMKKKQRDGLAEVKSAWKNVEVYERNVKELEEEGRRLSNLIAEQERMEMVATEFTKARILAVEKKINGAFKVVRFRLYTYTIEGNEQETCIPLIDGVPYGAANTASQINAGLDVIKTICRKEEVTAPIFIDNRERVNEIIPMPGHQIINLRVTEDSELMVNGKTND